MFQFSKIIIQLFKTKILLNTSGYEVASHCSDIVQNVNIFCKEEKNSKFKIYFS